MDEIEGRVVAHQGRVLIPVQRDPRVCIEPGCGRPTVRAHQGEDVSGFTPRCDEHSRERDERILDRGRQVCVCDRTRHVLGGPFCRERPEGNT